MVDHNKSIFCILPLQKILYKTQRILDKSQLQQEDDAYGGSDSSKSSTCRYIVQNTLNTSLDPFLVTHFNKAITNNNSCLQTTLQFSRNTEIGLLKQRLATHWEFY